MDTIARRLPWSVFKHTKPFHFYDDGHYNYDNNDDNDDDDGDEDND